MEFVQRMKRALQRGRPDSLPLGKHQSPYFILQTDRWCALSFPRRPDRRRPRTVALRSPEPVQVRKGTCSKLLARVMATNQAFTRRTELRVTANSVHYVD